MKILIIMLLLITPIQLFAAKFTIQASAIVVTPEIIPTTSELNSSEKPSSNTSTYSVTKIGNEVIIEFN